MIPYEHALLDLVRTDDRVMVLTAENRGHMRSVPDLLGDRFIDVGIAEQTMIGMAAGLAARGRIVITHALAAFLTMRAFEFIRDDVGIPSLPVTMVGMVPGVLSDGNGPTHQAIEDVALMRGIPGMSVFCPADEEDMIHGFRSIVLSGRPWYMRYTNAPAAVSHTSVFAPGCAETFLGDPSEAEFVILTYGAMFRPCIEAAGRLRSQGRSVCVVNMRTLAPIDEPLLRTILGGKGAVVTVEDHLSTGGLFSIVAECMARWGVSRPILPINLKTWFRPALLPSVLAHEGLTGESIAERILFTHVTSDSLETAHVD